MKRARPPAPAEEAAAEGAGAQSGVCSAEGCTDEANPPKGGSAIICDGENCGRTFHPGCMGLTLCGRTTSCYWAANGGAGECWRTSKKLAGAHHVRFDGDGTYLCPVCDDTCTGTVACGVVKDAGDEVVAARET